jgi:hypothetical protein
MSIPLISDLLFAEGAKIAGLPAAIANGQPLTWEQRHDIGQSIDNPWQYAYLLPGAATTISQIGITLSTVGTVSNPSPSTLSLFSEVQRFLLTSSATAGSLASLRSATARLTRGASAGKGGFLVNIPFGTPTLAVGNRAFIGISTGTGNPTNVDPLTSNSVSNIGMAINSETGNWNLIHNISSTAPTVIPLGANFPVNTTNFYDLQLSCPGGGAGVDYKITNRFAQVATEGIITNNLIAANVWSHVYAWITNNASATAAALAFSNVKMRYL